jgi:Zn-dependent oligopeptidase
LGRLQCRRPDDPFGTEYRRFHPAGGFRGAADGASRTGHALAEKQKLEPGAKDISDYESSYLTELVRRSQFDFDSTSIRPYFPYERVKQGVLDTAAKLFGLTFRQESGVPAWDPSVETWDPFDQGKMIGRFE